MNGERNIALIHEMGISPERRRMSASLGSDTVKELCTVPDLISQGTKNDIVCRVHHVSLSFSISLLPPLHRRQCAVKLTRMPNLGPKPLQKRLRTDGRQSQDVGAAGPKKKGGVSYVLGVNAVLLSHSLFPSYKATSLTPNCTLQI